MEFRNAKYNQSGTIDCEINHPAYGWIPITINEAEYPILYKQVVESGLGPAPEIEAEEDV